MWWKEVFADLNVISISLHQVSSSLWDCTVNCPFAALAQQWVTQKNMFNGKLCKTAISTATWTEGSTWLLISSHLWPVDPWSSFRRVPKSLEAFCLLEVPLYLSASKFILDKTDLTCSLLCNNKKFCSPLAMAWTTQIWLFLLHKDKGLPDLHLWRRKRSHHRNMVIVRFFIAEVDALRPNGKAPIYLDYNGWSSQPGFLGESELMGPNWYPFILQISL